MHQYRIAGVTTTCVTESPRNHWYVTLHGETPSAARAATAGSRREERHGDGRDAKKDEQLVQRSETYSGAKQPLDQPSGGKGFSSVVPNPHDLEPQRLSRYGPQDQTNREDRNHKEPPLFSWREQQGGEQHRIRQPEWGRDLPAAVSLFAQAEGSKVRCDEHDQN
jgi:hypothetical protein